MVKDERSRNRIAMVFLRNGLDIWVLKKCDQIILRDFEKVLPVPWSSEPGNQSHPKQIPPKTDGTVHVSCSHRQMIDSVEFYHKLPSL
jgi:hypothetical protein